MKALFLFLSLLTCLSATVSSQENTPKEQLQHKLDEAVARKEFVGGAAGISVGKKQYLAVAGHRNSDTEAPFETVTLNRIASIAKSMTAVAALQLVERGQLDLDVPIATYLPDYPARHAGRITTRQLLLHSSGIGEYQSAKEMESTSQYASLTEAATVFQDRDLVDEPGKAEHYTTYGYVVLGMVIEAVSGQTYEEYMQEHIWSPLEMNHTGVEDMRTSYDNKSNLYYSKKLGKNKPAKTNNLSNRVPGGGLYSTVGDVLKFGEAVLQHRLINEATSAMMLEKTDLPYDGNPYVMGWFLYGENPTLGEVYGHPGGQTGCSAVLLMLPEQEAVIVVMNNTSRLFQETFGLAVDLFSIVGEINEVDK